jgi:hypothetical protein
MKTKYVVWLILAGLLMPAVSLYAQDDTYYRIPLRQLQIDGAWPDQSNSAALPPLNWRQKQMLIYMTPRAAVDEGQVFIELANETGPEDIYRINSISQVLDNCHVVIKTGHNSPISGTLFVPRSDLSGMERLSFKVKPDVVPLEDAAGPRTFYAAMRKHYDILLRRNFTGGSWFRYQSMKTSQLLEEKQGFDPNTFQTPANVVQRDPYEESFGLFTGQQAVSENIQLDRTLQVFTHQPRTIDLSAIEGITTTSMDWKALTKDIKVAPDPLAAYIPADQHAIFYPTFRLMMDLMDQLKEGRQSLEPAGFSVARLDFYEQQMCVWLDGWSRFWGPKTIRGVALTGSDPYMTEGTDSAILFDASIGKLVYGNTESKQKDKLKEIKDAKFLTGAINGINYQAVVSPDRRVSSYLAQIDNVVVVTNSLAQMQKIVEVSQKKQPRMSDLDEYTFFRHRYNIDQNKQTAVVVLTDAAIRRWCSPKWRIGTARRTFAAAAMSHMQAAWLDEGTAFDLSQAQNHLQDWIPDIGTVTVTEAGITSSVYGNLSYMTPVAELAVDKVSVQEQQQYNRFRDLYQRQWRNFFDPIAVCVLHEPERTQIDMTVRPLIAASEYREWMRIGGTNTLKPGDGDPHPESIAQMIFAIDKNSEPVRQAGQFTLQMMPMESQTNAFGWLGRWVTVYADDSPFWQEFSTCLDNPQNNVDDFLEKNISRVPLAIAAEIENPASLTVFLISLRAFIQQTAPNMTVWESQTYKDQAYVKITIRYKPNIPQPPALYYAVLSNQLVISPNVELIKRAYDRSLLTNNKNSNADVTWAGQNIAVRVNKNGCKVIELLADENYTRWLQKQAWNNLSILTEWHTRKGRLTEAEFHERFWPLPLFLPSGTDYAWNETWRTVESTAFGHPGQPKIPQTLQTPLANVKQADAGITFEEDGLRAVLKIERQKK